MNSAFDERRQIDRSDGTVVNAKTGFWGVISYNPSKSDLSRDLEDSVADRFLHLHYVRWSSDFKAFVTTKRAKGVKKPSPQLDENFGMKLDIRGIGADQTFVRGERTGGGIKWFNFFNGLPASPPAYVYLVHDKGSIFKNKDNITKNLETLNQQAFGENEFARILSRFTDLLSSIASDGNSPLLKKIGLTDLPQTEDLELLALHESSARIEFMALRHYTLLVESGYSRYLAQSYATRLVIDQVCYGQYRDRKLRESTAYELVNMIAKSFKLYADNTVYNTRMITGSLL